MTALQRRRKSQARQARAVIGELSVKLHTNSIAQNGVLRCLYGMKTRTAVRASLALVVLALLCCGLSYGLGHLPKPRALRYQGVNTVRSVSMTLSTTNAPVAAQPSGQK